MGENIGETIMPLTIEEVKEIFMSEYAFLADRLKFRELTLKEAADKKTKNDTEVNSPGVYVFWATTCPRGVVKVGRSLVNSRRRAMEHIGDNTKRKDGTYGMKKLTQEPGAKLLLFNIRDKENAHWLLGLEYFLEKRLKPYIRSDRNG